MISMYGLDKQQYHSIIAQIAEHGTGIIQTANKEPPWLVRNVNGFIYVVENLHDNLACSVLIPIEILPGCSTAELERLLDERNRINSDKYGYCLKKVAGCTLIAISAYYCRQDFKVSRDIPALEHHALDLLSEL